MTVITEPLAILRNLLVGLLDLVTGRRRRRHETSIEIAAPRHVVWAVIRAREIRMAGLVPLHILTDTVPGRPDLERSRIDMNGQDLTMMLRIVDERPEEALLLEILEEDTDARVVVGDDDRIGFAILDGKDKTVLYLSREVTWRSWLATLTVPLGLRNGARRYKAKMEAIADTPREEMDAALAEAQKPQVKPSNFGLSPKGLLFSGAALASFSYLWGVEQALILAAIIIIHELGHALAMLMVGIPVKGVYLVPFFGGAAIAGAPYRSEGQIGFVALMGPAFSLISTLGLVLAAQHASSASLMKAAELSAFINLFNLVPIIPLDGGIVLKAALVSVSRVFAQAVGILGGLAGLYGAWYLGDAIIGLFVALGLVITWQMARSPVKETMRWPSVLLLLAAFGGTIAIYVAVIRTAWAASLGN